MAEEAKKSAPPSDQTTKSVDPSPKTTPPPKTDEDKDIEKQSQNWGDRIKKLPDQK